MGRDGRSSICYSFLENDLWGKSAAVGYNNYDNLFSPCFNIHWSSERAKKGVKDDGQYQEINEGEAIEYFNATGLRTTYYFTSQNVQESDILEEVISNTQLAGLVDQITVSEYTEDTSENANFVIGQFEHDKQVFWIDEAELEKVQDLAISMNQPAGMPSIPFVDGTVGVALDAGLLSEQEAADSMESMGISPERMGLMEQLGEFDSSSSLAKQLDDEQKAKEPSDEEKDVMLQQVIDHIGDDYITDIIQNAYGDGEAIDLSNVEIRGFDVVRLTDKEARDLYKQEKSQSDDAMWGIGITFSVITAPFIIPSLVALGATGALQYASNKQYQNSEEPVGGFYLEYDIVIKNSNGENEYIRGRMAPGENNPLDDVDYFTN
ncbi:MAG: hypothetical protein HN389_05695 [Clostridia bacterium]|jgi:hypothetical protein|nr:hypothetical protein [Clostridia bacterium]